MEIQVIIYNYHCNLVRRVLRKNKLRSLQPTPQAISKPMQLPTDKLKLNLPMFEVANFTQFSTKPSQLYLMGEIYWIHPIHFGRLSRFLKQPLSREMIWARAGARVLMVRASRTKLPKKRPRDIPLKPTKYSKTYKRKNWEAVLERPINQYKIKACSMGKMKAQGISIMLRLMKQAVVLYSLALYSFRKICLQRGKTRVMGTSAIIMELRDRKKKNPATFSRMVSSLQLPLLVRLQNSPPTQMQSAVVWKNLLLAIIGFLTTFLKSLATSQEQVVYRLSYTLRLTISAVSRFSICCCTKGFICQSNFEKQAGNLYLFFGSSWCMIDMKQSAGLQNQGHLSPNCRSKQLTAYLAKPWQINRPSTMRIRESKSAKISELGWWIVMMTVLFFSRAMSDRYLTMMKEVSESRPEVGSSRIITCGSLINSKAIEVLFLSPPEIPLIS